MSKRTIGLSLVLIIAVLTLLIWKQSGQEIAADTASVASDQVRIPDAESLTQNESLKRGIASADSKEATPTRKIKEPSAIKNEHRLKRWESIDLHSMIPFDPKNPDKHVSDRNRIRLRFFGEDLSFNRYKEVVNDSNSFTWIGTLEGNKNTLVSFTIADGVVIGEFNLINRFFSIRNDQTAGNILMEIDLTKPLASKQCQPIHTNPEDGSKRQKDSQSHAEKEAQFNLRPKEETLASNVSEKLNAFGLPNIFENLSLGSKAEAAVTPYIIDILVLGRTGVTNVGPIATNLVAYTNAALARSGVNAQLRLRYAGGITQAPNLFPFGPKTEEYKNLIIKYQPDRVVFLHPNCSGGICGMAQFQPKMSHVGYSIHQAWASTSGSATVYFAHEVGHLLGANHQDPYRGEVDTRQSESFAQAYASDKSGNKFAPNSYGTIVSQYMANHYPYYSSPSHYGDASHDNVRAINLLVAKVSETMPRGAVNQATGRMAFLGNSMHLNAFSIGDTSYIVEGGAPVVLSNTIFEWFKAGKVIRRVEFPYDQDKSSVPDRLMFTNIQAADAGMYTLKVTMPLSPPVSQTVELKVLQPPAISISPNPASLGGKVTFSAPLYDGTFNYTWKRNGLTSMAGENRNVVTIDSASSAHFADWQLTVTDKFGSYVDGVFYQATGLSNVVQLKMGTAPLVTTQPIAKTITVGGSAVFSAAATGTAPLTYQWLKNGAAISGATGTSYGITSAQTSHAGTYSVRVTNPFGNATSSGALLTVGSLPAITTQPIARTIAVGASTAFSAAATGTAPLTYQWLKNGAAISGATGASYSISSAQTTHAGTYSVQVTNSFGNVASTGALLTVGNLPVITTQPIAKTIAVGGSAAFSIAATSTAPLTYQWLKNGTAISGATDASYSISSAQTTHAGTYSVQVTNSFGNVTSSGALLAVGNPPVITTQSIAKTIAVGGSAAFSVTATGSAPLTYQWLKNGAAISGATDASYSISNAQTTHAGTYSVLVTNSFGNVTSTGALLTVGNSPVITIQPIAQTLIFGADGILSVTATGAAPLTYIWKKDGNIISGATTSSLSINDVQSVTAGKYLVEVSNSFGKALSSEIQIKVKMFKDPEYSDSILPTVVQDITSSGGL